jgi:hypothetical protein
LDLARADRNSLDPCSSRVCDATTTDDRADTDQLLSPWVRVPGMFHRLAALQSRLTKRHSKISFEWHLLHVYDELDLGRVWILLLQLSVFWAIGWVDLQMRKFFHFLPWSFVRHVVSDIVLWEQSTSVRWEHAVYRLLKLQPGKQHLAGRAIIICHSRDTATTDDPTTVIGCRVFSFGRLTFVAAAPVLVRVSGFHSDSIGTGPPESSCAIVWHNQSAISHNSSHIYPVCCSVAKHLVD